MKAFALLERPDCRLLPGFYRRIRRTVGDLPVHGADGIQISCRASLIWGRPRGFSHKRRARRRISFRPYKPAPASPWAAPPSGGRVFHHQFKVLLGFLGLLGDGIQHAHLGLHIPRKDRVPRAAFPAFLPIPQGRFRAFHGG